VFHLTGSVTVCLDVCFSRCRFVGSERFVIDGIFELITNIASDPVFI